MPSAGPADSGGLGAQPPAGSRDGAPVGVRGAKPPGIKKKIGLFWTSETEHDGKKATKLNHEGHTKTPRNSRNKENHQLFRKKTMNINNLCSWGESPKKFGNLWSF